MGPDFVQHAIVTLAAIGAAWFVARRVFTFVKPSGGGAPKCASCPSAAPQRAGVAFPAAQAHKPIQPRPSDIKPLPLIRR